MANGRCDVHGGKSIHGIAHHNYKDGRTSKYPKVPKIILEGYEALQSDPELLNLSDDAALLAARVNQLLGRLESGEAKERWRLVKEAWRTFRTAQKMQDQITMADMVKNLDFLLSGDPHDYLVWDDIIKTMKEYRATAAQEQKRRLEMNALISVEEALAFAGQILTIVKDNVSDPKELTAIRMEAQLALAMRPGMAKAMAKPKDEENGG